MDEINKRLKLARWISREMLGPLAEEEREELQKWLAESPEHAHVLERIRERIKAGELETGREYIAHTGWNCFEKKTFRRFSWRRLYPYAAAVALPLLVATYLLFRDTPQVEETHGLVHSIQAGSSKALLLLADGREVDLDTMQQLSFREKDGTAISLSDDQVLQYQSEEGERSKEEYYHTLLIPKGGEYKLQLADGTLVWLNAATELRYPVYFSGGRRVVELQGEAYFEVAKDAEKPFIIKTKAGPEIRVLGTKFNISAYEDDVEVVTTLVNGKVEMAGAQASVVILPDEQVHFDRNTGKFSKRKVDAAMYAAWKDGLFVFEDCPLEQIMKRLERWYDIEVSYTDEEIRQIRFDGDLKKYDDFHTALGLLEKVAGIKMNVINKRVVIGMK